MEEKNNVSNTKQTIFVVIGIFLISTLILGGTYAYLSNAVEVTNNVIAGNTTCFNINYDITNDSDTNSEHGTDIAGTLFPSGSAGGGLSGKVSIGISSACSINGYANLYLDITTGSDILFQNVDAHCENSQTLKTLTNYTNQSDCEAQTNGIWVTTGTALKYAVFTSTDTSNTVPVSVGYITGLGQVNVYDNFSITPTMSNYYVYIWLDGNISDDTYVSQSLSGYISAEASQVSGSGVVEPNAPVLDPGMIPVTIANDGTVTTVSSTDSSWYNYSNKEWANAVLVNSSSRSNYLGTTGKTVSSSDILAYYVWIPRYKYRIPNNLKCSSLSNPSIDINQECYSYTMSDSDKELFTNYWYEEKNASFQEKYGLTYSLEEATEDVETMLNTGKVYMEQEDYTYWFTDIVDLYNDDNDTPITYTAQFNGNNTATGPRPIDISFETIDASISIGDAVTSYRTHPAFTWDGENVPGIWVGKFEATGDATTPTILPNISSLRSQNVSTQFTTSLKFAGGTLSSGIVSFTGNNTYGLVSTTDSHMMKNSEWGAVAYLSHSQYGINYEIRINNNSSKTTGCGASGENGSSTSECQIAYGSGVASYPQSTTGNITGIFDMSGGAWERVMGVYSDSDGNPMSGYSSSYNSGFNGLLNDGTTYSSGIAFPSSKYYDLYLSSQFTGNYDTNMSLCTLETCGGHALYETAGWYNDYAYFVGSGNPWFMRGGYSTIIVSIAGAFGAYNNYGIADSNYSWRSVLVVDGA